MNALISPIEVQKYLEGVNYPASKDDLVQAAQENDAGQEIFDVINRLPEKEYAAPTEVSSEISKLNE